MEEQQSEEMIKKVCVTGGSGYIGSWLVKKLLLKGYMVHATLRDLNDSFKVEFLKSLPEVESRLKLFEADIYNPDEFEKAIVGCEYVFHVATPMQHNKNSSQYKDTSEAAVAGVKSIAESCIKSGTIKRLIYTASVMAASPIKECGTEFKDSIDESCWTPINLSFSQGNDFSKAYTVSKTLAEKEVLKYNNGSLEVVSLACGLVGGDTLLPNLSASQEVILSFLTGNNINISYLRLLQQMLGSVPLIHVDDVCEAHVFCMENPLINGRFLCAATYPTIAQIGMYYREKHPQPGLLAEGLMEGEDRAVKCGSTKLKDMGFEYKYDLNKIIDENVNCARKLGVPI